jgi:hypothetical protein
VPPDPRFGARYLDLAHVAELKVGFRGTATVNAGMKVVVVNDKLHAAFRRMQGLNPDLIIRSGEVQSNEQLLSLFVEAADGDEETLQNMMRMVVSGNHSRVALNELSTQFSHNEKFQMNEASWYVAPDNDMTMRMLTLLGISDNSKKTKKSGFREFIIGMHDRYVLMANSLDDDQEKFYAARVKKDMTWAIGEDMNANTMGQWWSLAQIQGPLWDAICPILRGEFETNTTTKIKNSVPASCSHFVRLAGIPVESAVSCLDQVRLNQITWATCAQKLSIHKCTRRIMIDASKLAYTNGFLLGVGEVPKNKASRASSNQFWLDAFESVTAAAPALNDEWVYSQAQAYKDVLQGTPLPEAFWESISGAFKAAKRDSEYKQVSHAPFSCQPLSWCALSISNTLTPKLLCRNMPSLARNSPSC